MLEVPLLALAAALEPALRPVFYVVTVVVALNMNLFDGVGSGMRWAIPRDITFIDASVIVAAVNVMALFWLSGLLTDLAAESRGALQPDGRDARLDGTNYKFCRPYVASHSSLHVTFDHYARSERLSYRKVPPPLVVHRILVSAGSRSPRARGGTAARAGSRHRRCCAGAIRSPRSTSP